MTEEITAYDQSIITHFPTTDERLSEIIESQYAASYQSTVKSGWPSCQNVSQECTSFWEQRHSIFVQKVLMMFARRIIIAACLRKDISNCLYEGRLLGTSYQELC